MYYVENELKKLLRVKTICAPLLHTRGKPHQTYLAYAAPLERFETGSYK